MEIVTRRMGKIINKLSDLTSQDKELKINSGASSHSVRQWKKDVKSRNAVLMATSFPGSLILPPGASEERPW